MTKIYVNQREVTEKKVDYMAFFIELLVSAVTLMIASALFRNFYVENIWYALIASVIISVLNVSIKPILVFLTLPVTIMSLGILYPIVNLIILKLTSLLLGDAFIIEGWILAFFISIFISALTLIFKKFVLSKYKEER